MAIATLDSIILKVRKLTGTGNSLQLTDSQIIDYINSFYLYDFPAQYRSLKLKDKYVFNTQYGIDVYPFDSDHWSTIEMPCYCAKREIKLFNDPWNFYGVWFNWQQTQNLTQGDGTSGVLTGSITNVTQANPAVVTSANHGLVNGKSVIINNVGGMVELNGNTYIVTVINLNDFSLNVDSTTFTPYTIDGNWTSSGYEGILSSHPLIRSVNNNPMATTTLNSTTVFPSGSPPSFPQTNIGRIQNLLITVNTAYGTTLNVTDDGAGNLIGDVNTTTPNTINYETGSISISFSSDIPQGQTINVQYNPTQPNIPLAIMFNQNQFTLRPVPDKGYTIELTGYRLPSQAMMGSEDPNQPNLSGRPELQEWWETIAFGAAKKIYEDRLDPDGVILMDKGLAERYSLNETRTYAQMGKNRVGTIYQDQITGNYGSTGWGFGSGMV